MYIINVWLYLPVSCTIFFRYISRCLLIEFFQPHLDASIEEYALLPALMRRGSAAVGAVLRLGKLFIESGIADINQYFVPVVKNALGGDALPRVVPSYALLLWFTLQVSVTSQVEASLSCTVHVSVDCKSSLQAR